MKITIFSKQDWKLTATRGKKIGTEIAGFSYSGFTEEGKALRFTSNKGDRKIYPTKLAFDSNACEEVELEPNLFNGNLTYREALPKA